MGGEGVWGVGVSGCEGVCMRGCCMGEGCGETCVHVHSALVGKDVWEGVRV